MKNGEKERVHNTRVAFKDWQLRRASTIMTVLAYKGGGGVGVGVGLAGLGGSQQKTTKLVSFNLGEESLAARPSFLLRGPSAGPLGSGIGQGAGIAVRSPSLDPKLDLGWVPNGIHETGSLQTTASFASDTLRPSSQIVVPASAPAVSTLRSPQSSQGYAKAPLSADDTLFELRNSEGHESKDVQGSSSAEPDSGVGMAQRQTAIGAVQAMPTDETRVGLSLSASESSALAGKEEDALFEEYRARRVMELKGVFMGGPAATPSPPFKKHRFAGVHPQVHAGGEIQMPMLDSSGANAGMEAQQNDDEEEAARARTHLNSVRSYLQDASALHA